MFKSNKFLIFTLGSLLVVGALGQQPREIQRFCEGAPVKCYVWAVFSPKTRLCDEALQTASPQCRQNNCVEFPCGMEPTGLFCRNDGSVDVNCLPQSLSEMQRDYECWQWLEGFVSLFFFTLLHSTYFQLNFFSVKNVKCLPRRSLAPEPGAYDKLGLRR